MLNLHKKCGIIGRIINNVHKLIFMEVENEKKRLYFSI